jgi:SAM-dependent methyltransferase
VDQHASTRDQQRLYGDLAWTWPLISRPENYAGEAAQFHAMVQRYARCQVCTLLDLGCGGGHNDFHLKQYHQVTGADLSVPMLAHARRLNPECTYLQGDMRSVRLGRTFDAVIVADSIGYMLNEADLRAAFQTAWDHLNPGGVFCTYAEVCRERFHQNRTNCTPCRQGDIELVFVENYYDPDPADTTYEMTFIYLIRRAGRLTIETDRHMGGVFPLSTWLQLLAEVGFAAEQLECTGEHVPFFVGVKPLPGRP